MSDAPIPLPAEYVGAWYRVDIAIDGGEPAETQTVWWLQASFAFADIRVPLAEGGDADSFAGHTTWEAPALTWDRHLDLHQHPVADTGTITWDSDDMLEDGVFGFAGSEELVAYRERWRRLPDPGGSGYVALRNDTGRLVVVGNHAITIVDDRATGGSYRAVGWRRPSVLWEQVLSWPPDTYDLSQPPDDTGSWEAGSTVRLDDGTSWLVEDIAP